MRLLLLNHIKDTNISLNQLDFSLDSSDKSSNMYIDIRKMIKPNHLEGIVFKIA